MNNREDESRYTGISRDARNVGNSYSRRNINSSRNGIKNSENSIDVHSNRTDRSTREDRNIRDADNSKTTKMLETPVEGVSTTKGTPAIAGMQKTAETQEHQRRQQ
jgi:hypothetical protein